ncbi:hypothetical protein KFK09_024283 [Dendrobium nobile]|uniref:Uncharacterized protein n=1 Tax=Dendrobium nobile TaxID=94219 RepID=A0A8T3AEF0_DENNO|nr:hypothetical protein KFK09_024283 [Dendrobium nobile]
MANLSRYTYPRLRYDGSFPHAILIRQVIRTVNFLRGCSSSQSPSSSPSPSPPYSSTRHPCFSLQPASLVPSATPESFLLSAVPCFSQEPVPISRQHQQ